MLKDKSIKVRYLAGTKIVDFRYYTAPLLKKQQDKIVLQKGNFDNKKNINCWQISASIWFIMAIMKNTILNFVTYNRDEAVALNYLRFFKWAFKSFDMNVIPF